MGNYMAGESPPSSVTTADILWCFFCPGGSDHKGSTLLFLYKEKNILNHLTVNFLKFASLLVCKTQVELNGIYVLKLCFYRVIQMI